MNPTSHEVLLEVKNLSVRVGANLLVNKLSFTLTRGERLTILGETGSGKSILMQAIIGLLPEGMEREGQIRMAGRDVDAIDRKELENLWGREVAMLPQEPWHALDPLMPAREQVSEVYECVCGHGPAATRQITQLRLEDVQLSTIEEKLPGQLSGGMAQRLAFCAATSGGARIVLADEPTKGLDDANRNQLIHLLAELAREGCVLTITHDIEVARRLPGKILVMQGGKVKEQGTTAEVLEQPKSAYARALIDATKRQKKTSAASPTARQPTPLIAARKLCKSRSGKTLFADLDITLHTGELVGLSGPSGVGKSTLGDILLGLLPPDKGTVVRRSAEDLRHHRLQKLYQDPPSAFASHLPLGHLLGDVLARHDIRPARLISLLNRLNLDRRLLERAATEVSGGELQRLALARALLLNPAFLFADEPTSRLDPITSRSILELLREVATEFGCAILLVSHDHHLLDDYCDRTLVLEA